MNYPKVVGEFETVRKLLEGYSISRFGDGEFKMADGKGYVREDPNPRIARELSSILVAPSETCLVGIPTMDKSGPKFSSWARHEKRFAGMLSESMTYYSAFISRPDSAPWIMVREFAELMQELWAGKKAVVICEPDNSLLRVVGKAARKVEHIECPSSGSYAHIADFRKAVLKAKPDIALLSVGPTATCLAHRLSNRVQAIDLGSAGGFLRKLLA